MAMVSLFILGWIIPIGQTPPPETGVDPRVDQILTELESVGAGVTDLRCVVHYTVVDMLNLDEYTKEGELLYRANKPNPAFHVHFTKRMQGGTVNRDREWWLFDGEWLWEVNEGIGQITKRQIVRTGETVDLFNIEDSPFPVPFGQKKDQILKHFDVTLVAPMNNDPKDTDHLKCVPKTGSRLEEDYDALDFYVLRDLHLPCRIVATEKRGLKIITSDFPGLSRQSVNTDIKPDVFAPSLEWKKFGTPVIEPLPEEKRP